MPEFVQDNLIKNSNFLQFINDDIVDENKFYFKGQEKKEFYCFEIVKLNTEENKNE